jgi:hypothetical protein
MGEPGVAEAPQQPLRALRGNIQDVELTIIGAQWGQSARMG